MRLYVGAFEKTTMKKVSIFATITLLMMAGC